MTDKTDAEKAEGKNAPKAAAEGKKKDETPAGLEASAVSAQQLAMDKAAAQKTVEETKARNEAKLKEDADYAKAVEGTGGLLAPHLKKFRERRGEWHPNTPEDAVQQEKSDQAACRKLVADLILQSGSGIMAGLTEAEQKAARELAIKLKA